MKRPAVLALALYAAFLFGIAVWRPWATPAEPFSGRWEPVPFTGTADLWRAGIVPFVFLFVGNVACFVPFGFGLPALTPLRRAVIPLCFLGSLLIEALQWAFGTGVPQVEDILLNTLGALGQGHPQRVRERAHAGVERIVGCHVGWGRGAVSCLWFAGLYPKPLPDRKRNPLSWRDCHPAVRKYSLTWSAFQVVYFPRIGRRVAV